MGTRHNSVGYAMPAPFHRIGRKPPEAAEAPSKQHVWHKKSEGRGSSPHIPVVGCRGEVVCLLILYLGMQAPHLMVAEPDAIVKCADENSWSLRGEHILVYAAPIPLGDLWLHA